MRRYEQQSQWQQLHVKLIGSCHVYLSMNTYCLCSAALYPRLIDALCCLQVWYLLQANTSYHGFELVHVSDRPAITCDNAIVSIGIAGAC